MRKVTDIFRSFNKYAWRNPRDPRVMNEIANAASAIEAAKQNRELYREIRLPTFWAKRYHHGDQFAVLLRYLMETRHDEEKRAPNMVFSYSGDE